MSQINYYATNQPVEAEASHLLESETQSPDLSSKIANDLSYGELLRKLTYTIIDIIRKPRYFLVFAFARFRTVRYIYSFFAELLIGSKTTATTGDDSTSLFSQADTINIVKTLKQDGVFLGFSLPQNFLSQLMQSLNNRDCYAGGRPDIGFRIAHKAQIDKVFPQPFYVARYFNISHDCPQIVQLVNDPKLREIATKYIGKQAKYTGSSLFWTFPVEGESSDWEQQKFRYYHYDIDDVSGVRFCFYLTDVTLDNGPHVCIKGSHIKKSLSHVLNYLSRIQPETELAKVYDPEQFVTITGSSGYGFIEDTFCFHKGAPPQNQPRLFLQLHFAVHNYNQEQSYLDVRDPKTLRSYPLFQETYVQ